MTPVPTALVGLGEHAWERLVPALGRVDGLELVAAVDPDAAARDRAATELAGLPTASTLDELPDRVGVAAVIVAAPPLVAPRIADDALARGWAVYLEKPGAVGSADLPRADAGGPPVVPGLCYRHDPAVAEAVAAVRGGDVGRVVALRFVFASPGPPTGWRATPAHGGGALRDLGIHDIDLARVLTGDEPESATAQIGSRHGDDDTASVGLLMRGGAVVQILAVQGAAEASRFEVHGEAAGLVVDRWSAPWVTRRGARAAGPARAIVEGAALAARPAVWRAAQQARRPGTAQERALAAFAARVRGEAGDVPALGDLHTALAVVETCERAAATGSRVAIG